MAKHMTDAAQLYWHDLDVLEEARDELSQYFATVKGALTDHLCQIWIEDDRNDVKTDAEAQERFNNRSWNSREFLGMLGLKTGGKDEIPVKIEQPNVDWGRDNFTVRIGIGVAQKRQIEKVAGVVDQLTAIAAENDISLCWEDTELYVRKVPFGATDDADDIGRALAETALELLVVCAKMETVLR